MRKVLLPAFAAACAAAVAGQAAAESLLLGGYPNHLLLVDEERGALTERIELDTGLPISMQQSNDGRFVYVSTITTGGIEIFDTQTRRVVKRFSLDTPLTRYRFWGGAADPSGRYFYTVGTRIDKDVDRYRVSEPQYLVIDLEREEVVRSAAVADEDQAGRSQLLVSEDGGTLYAFGEKVLMIDTETLEVAKRIDLAKRPAHGIQEVGFGRSIETLRTPGEYVSMFTATDPYIQNEVFGIARFDLASRTADFSPIGPAPDRISGLEVTPDGKTGYTVTSNGELGNRRCEFWRFDLETNEALGRSEFPCRSRFTFGMSSDGEKLYIYAAGYEIEVFDAESFEREAVWDLGNDITGAGMLFLR